MVNKLQIRCELVSNRKTATRVTRKVQSQQVVNIVQKDYEDKMRITGYIDRSNQKQHLFTALVQECQLANPTSRYKP